MSEKIQPKVRFSGFTDAWEQRKLGDVVDWSRGEGLSKKYLNTKKNGIPAIHYADLYKFGPIMRQTLHFTNSHTGKVLKEGDLLFPMSDVTPKGLARVVSVITNGILAGGDILIASPQKDFGSFLSYEINKNKGQILRYVTGTTIRHINANSLSKLIVHGTKKAEELEISKLLISIDSLIAANQSKLEELKTVKKLAMQKVFDQEWRFRGFTDPWEQRKLGDIGAVSMNKRIFKDQTASSGDIPFYKIGTFGKKADSYIPRKLFNEYRKKFSYPEIGDTLISASGSIGRTVEYKGEEAYFQDSNIVWLKHSDEVENSFLRQFYKVVKWPGLEGSTIKRLYNKDILKTPICLPVIQEQRKVGELLTKLDSLIAANQQKYNQLKKVKKWCMQNLFV